jgi:hypothetical protein
MRNRLAIRDLGRGISILAKQDRGLSRVIFVAAFLHILTSFGSLASPGDQWIVGDDGATLFEEPGEGAASVGNLSGGQRVLEFNRQDGWVRIGVLGGARREGWLPLEELNTGEEFGDFPEPPAPKPQPEILQLQISGTPGLELRLTCDLVDKSGERKFERKVRVRTRRRLDFEVSALSCRLKKLDAFGRLEAAIIQNGRRIVDVRTAAAYNYIEVRSSGPWGKARAVRGNVAIVRTATPAAKPKGMIPLLPQLRRQRLKKF